MENFTAEERETTIRLSDADDLVHIWTAQRPVITKLRKNDAFTETGSGVYGTSPWAEFTIPAERFAFSAKRLVTEETKLKLRQRANTHGFGVAS